MIQDLFFLALLVPIAIVLWFLFLPPVTTVFTWLFPSPPVERGECRTDFACIITVYKNLEIAKPLVHSLLKQTHRNFHVYLVADRVEDPNSWDLVHEKFTLIQPNKPLDSKVSSIRLATNSFLRNHDAIVIYDPDNLAEFHALEVFDHYFYSGYKAVQGKRIAKNINTTYAALDALGEYYYDFMTRNATFEAGSSSTLAGSGMAIHARVYLDYLQLEQMDSSDGRVILAEDKLLQQYLVAEGYRIAYAGDSICFDEKVSSASAVERQRTRWMRAYFEHALDGLSLLGNSLRTLSWNKFWYSFFILFPPLFLLIGSTIVLIIICFWINHYLMSILLAALFAFAMNFFLSLYLNRAPIQIWKAVPTIPLFVANQILGTLRMNRAKNDFLATTHVNYLSIEEVWTLRAKDFKPKWWKKP